MLNFVYILSKKYQGLFTVNFQNRHFTKEIAILKNKKVPTWFEVSTDSTTKPVLNYDKSLLLFQHLRLLNGKHPYSQPNTWIHVTGKYKKKMYGCYGSASGIDPRMCFSTKEDFINQKEYEYVAYTYSLKHMLERNIIEKDFLEQQIIKREKNIEKKKEKLETWKADLNARAIKKESNVAAMKERKERLLEEVRRHFGFKIDSRDEKFKEMLEQKEKDDKKKQKEVKKKVKEDKILVSLISYGKK